MWSGGHVSERMEVRRHMERVNGGAPCERAEGEEEVRRPASERAEAGVPCDRAKGEEEARGSDPPPQYGGSRLRIAGEGGAAVANTPSH